MKVGEAAMLPLKRGRHIAHLSAIASPLNLDPPGSSSAQLYSHVPSLAVPKSALCVVAEACECQWGISKRIAAHYRDLGCESVRLARVPVTCACICGSRPGVGVGAWWGGVGCGGALSTPCKYDVLVTTCTGHEIHQYISIGPFVRPIETLPFRVYCFAQLFW